MQQGQSKKAGGKAPPRHRKKRFLCRFWDHPGPKIDEFEGLGCPGGPGNLSKSWAAEPHRDIAKQLFICRFWGSPGPKKKTAFFSAFFWATKTKKSMILGVWAAPGSRETFQKSEGKPHRDIAKQFVLCHFLGCQGLKPT